jgi:hypothetical protein
MTQTYGTGFAQAGFTYDANISPFNQGFSLAVQAVIARTPVNSGTSFVNIVVTGTATIATLQVTTATIATVNISTATITRLVVGTGTFSLLSASGTATLGALVVTGTASIPAISGAIAANSDPLTAATTRVVTGLVALKTTSGTATNATPATDAALTVTFNETGWYFVEIWLAFYEATSGAGGFQFNFLNGGTAGFASLVYSVEGFSTAAIALAAAIASSSTSVTASTCSTASSQPSWFRAKGYVNVNSAGSAGVQWAQASTLAIDPTTLMAGSYVLAIKIG